MRFEKLKRKTKNNESNSASTSGDSKEKMKKKFFFLPSFVSPAKILDFPVPSFKDVQD